MVHRQIRTGSSFGRLAIPFLLLFLLIYVDARVIRCRSGGCERPAALAQLADSNNAAIRTQLNFPLSEGFWSSSAFGGEELSAEGSPVAEEQAPTTPSAAAPRTSAAAPRSASQTQTAVAPPRLPTDREITEADVNAFVEQAQRYFRTYGRPEDRRTVDGHPRAGGDGSGNSVNLAPGGAATNQPSQPAPATNFGSINTSAGSGSAGPNTFGPPPAPPPGQGGGGSFAPGSPGEPAGGFLG
ncbi:MAG: hypothetical protein ACT4OM_07070 [Actinomycetota bacterium]